MDAPVRVRIEGAPPRGLLRVVAQSRDSDGALHESWAEFRADTDGCVRPDREPPLAGSYDGIDPLGLWWSMTSRHDRAFGASLDPVPTRLSVAVGNEPPATAEFERLRRAADVTVEDVRVDGLVGTLFLPPRPVAPAVVVLGGSEGGLSQAAQLGALMASRGFAALALAYFGVDGLPPQLVEIPVEYVEGAITWLSQRPEASGPPVGLLGLSRGGELALLVASGCPQVGAVVAFCGSPLLWPGIGSGWSHSAAWARNGVPLPYAVPALVDAEAPSTNGSVELVGRFLRGLDDGHAPANAHIPLERIEGPVFLAAGGDDRLWPSTRFAELAMRALARADRPYPDRRDAYPAAGHAFLRPPALPAGPTSTIHPFDGRRYALGGTRAGNGRAAATAWPRALAFLREALPRR